NSSTISRTEPEQPNQSATTTIMNRILGSLGPCFSKAINAAIATGGSSRAANVDFSLNLRVNWRLSRVMSWRQEDRFGGLSSFAGIEQRLTESLPTVTSLTHSL